jgi:hypothetical protein
VLFLVEQSHPAACGWSVWKQKKKNKTKQNIYFAQFAPFGTSNVLSVRFVVYCHVLDLLRVECR